jgi:hypothetical protein
MSVIVEHTDDDRCEDRRDDKQHHYADHDRPPDLRAAFMPRASSVARAGQGGNCAADTAEAPLRSWLIRSPSEGRRRLQGPPALDRGLPGARTEGARHARPVDIAKALGIARQSVYRVLAEQATPPGKKGTGLASIPISGLRNAS